MAEMSIIRNNLHINVELASRSSNWATHVYANDLETLSAGVAIKSREEGVRLIYDAHEIWPHQWKEGFRSAAFVGFHEALERHLIRYVDTGITVCESIASFYRATCPGSNFHVIYNSPPRSRACMEEAIVEDETFRLYYHGIYNQGRGLETVALALEKLPGVDFSVRLVGDYSDFERFVKENGLADRVHFLSPVGVSELVEAATGFTVGVCPFLDDCLNTQYCLPNKIFEYMLAGCVICASEMVEMKQIIENHGIGLVHEPGNIDQFVDCITALRRDPARLYSLRKRARRVARTVLGWEANATALNRIFDAEGI